MRSQLVKKFNNFFSKHKNSRIAVAMHRRADMDAMASAYAISHIFKNSTICTIDEPNFPAKNLAKHLSLEYSQIANLRKDEFEGMIVVDTSSYGLLKDARDWNILCIIDHHTPEGRDMKSNCEIIDDSCPSTAELIASLLPENKINKKMAFALACGIIADTARFKRAEKETFSTLSKLMAIANVSYTDLLNMAEPEYELDEKISILKAFQRLKYNILGEFVVVTSEVGNNEGNAAALLSEVADIAFVASWREAERETRLSARSRKHVTIELDKIMASVSAELGGSGGGHMHAAGAIVKFPPEIALKKCIEKVIEAQK